MLQYTRAAAWYNVQERLHAAVCKGDRMLQQTRATACHNIQGRPHATMYKGDCVLQYAKATACYSMQGRPHATIYKGDRIQYTKATMRAMHGCRVRKPRALGLPIGFLSVTQLCQNKSGQLSHTQKKIKNLMMLCGKHDGSYHVAYLRPQTQRAQRRCDSEHKFVVAQHWTFQRHVGVLQRHKALRYGGLFESVNTEKIVNAAKPFASVLRPLGEHNRKKK